MRNLPWYIAKCNPALVIDNKGCTVVDLSYFHATGDGHNKDEIAQFLVSRANDLAEKETRERKREQPAKVDQQQQGGRSAEGKEVQSQTEGTQLPR